MKVEKGKMVKLEYELSLETGELLETSASKGPLVYQHGEGTMLPGIERAIEGLSRGAEKEGILQADDAYGTISELPTRELSRQEFPANEEITAGKSFQAKDAEGNPIQFTVIEVDDEKVTVRFDHPLAGKKICYKVKILDVTDPN